MHTMYIDEYILYYICEATHRGVMVACTHSVVHEGLETAYTLVLDLPQYGILTLVGTCATGLQDVQESV